ncbi:MAG: dienelactone hydrolase family protein [Actinobacteria bacterium]|nr:dienelactone hydrolase family protein [Actinomycetota bacterium]
MSPTRLDVTTADGVMDVYLHEPPSGEPGPAVIYIADAAGVRPVVQEMAALLAATGYLVAVPNLYYRAGDYEPFDIATLFQIPAERDRMRHIIGLAGENGLAQDTGALLDALAGHQGRSGEQAGCVGYCMGGNWAFRVAAAHPDRIGAAASFHGGNLASDDPGSPHRQADRIRARLYFGVADGDPSCSPASQAQLVTALSEAGVGYQLELYPGAGHGFSVPDNPSYNQAAAQRHWKRLGTLLEEAL